jgi:hypothetical protein
VHGQAHDDSVEGNPSGFRHLRPLTLGAPIRLPNPDGGPLDRAAVAANQRRCTDARHVFSTWFPQLDDLLPPSHPAVTECTPRLALSDLVALIDELLVFDDCRPPRLRVEAPPRRDRDAEIPFRSTYDLFRPDVGTLLASTMAGSALVLSSIERHHLRLVELVRAVETILGPSAGVDAVVAETSSRLSLEQRDDVAALVIPLLGSVTTVDQEIGPGRAIALPGGEAAVLDFAGPMRALILWLPVVSVRRLAANVAVAAARRHPLIRADYPVDPDTPVLSYGGSFLDAPGRYGDLLAEVLTSDELGRSVATLRASARPHLTGPFRLAAGALADLPTRIRACSTGGVMMVDTNLRTLPVLSGVSIDAADEVLEYLVAKADGRPFDTSAWRAAAGCSRSDLAHLVAELVVAGLVEALP